MENVPNEVLEKILSYVSGRDNLMACRLVGKRWNAVAVKFWRHLNKVRVEFLADQRIHEFLWEMDFRIQDFPFTRFRFTSVDSENVTAVSQLLRECSQYIRDLDIRVLLDTRIEEEGKDQVDLISCLQTSVLPNLGELRVEEMWLPIALPIPELQLSNLRILTLPFGPVSHPIPAALIKGAPNLQILAIPIELTDPSFLWPLPDTCKHISCIQVNLKIHLSVEVNTAPIAALLQKLEEWSNVRIQKLSLAVSAPTQNQNLVLQTTVQLQRLLDGQADSIKEMTMVTWPGTFQQRLRIPAMAELRDLDICFDRGHLQRVDGVFPRLQMVTLRSYRESSVVFRSAKLESVQTFVLYASPDAEVTGDYTPWDKVFPNLTSFTYYSNYNSDSHPAFNFNTLESMVSIMRMDSLTNVQYKAFGTDPNRLNEERRQWEQVQINRIFSGYDDLDQMVEMANEVREQGGDAEELYWRGLERHQRPCLANMKGIKKLQLDLPMDDDFAIGVLLRLNPLDLLTIDAKELSLDVFCRVISRHNSFCSSSVE